MLSNEERVAFDDIVRALGPVAAEPSPGPYLAPWWVPPAVVLSYVPMLVAMALFWHSAGYLVPALAAAVGGSVWAVVRHRVGGGGEPIDLLATPPWID